MNDPFSTYNLIVLAAIVIVFYVVLPLIRRKFGERVGIVAELVIALGAAIYASSGLSGNPRWYDGILLIFITWVVYCKIRKYNELTDEAA